MLTRFLLAFLLLIAPALHAADVFEQSNLAAWCIVPFDGAKRGPVERAAMLKQLGFTKFVYDYRAEHIPQWDAEMEALKKQNISLIGWWFPTTLNDEARRILDTIKRHGMTQCDLWVTGSSQTPTKPEEKAARLTAEITRIRSIAGEAAKLGVRVGLYNHGGWFGVPENQIAIIEALRKEGVTNVGIVFNLHHGHGQLGRFSIMLEKVLPYLICLNLNGMDLGGDANDRKILPVGEGTEDLRLIREIRYSGYTGPIGILNHTDADAEVQLKRNLEGLTKILSQLDAPTPATFQPALPPLHPDSWPHWQAPVNRDRIFDYYAKQAQHFMKVKPLPTLLAAAPGLDSGKYGHWGNQDEDSWRDARWGKSDLGSLLCAPIRSDGLTLPKAVCLRLGDQGELTAVFDPQTLSFPLLRQGGFLQINDVRHGFMGGVSLAGKAIPQQKTAAPSGAFIYRGFYRMGSRVVFTYDLQENDKMERYLDSAWVTGGQFTRQKSRSAEHTDAATIAAAQFPTQWPGWIELKGKIGQGNPFAIDTLPIPFENPYGTLFFISAHDFLPDGTAVVATMTGEVWLVKGIDATLEKVRWKRFATGLQQPLGVKVTPEGIYVLGRDQITRLHDLNRDDEADYYECVTNAYKTSPGGHDYITGLEQDSEGRFYFASGTEGVCRIKPGDAHEEVLATGLRNPNHLARSPEGLITVGLQEGDWVPASGVAEFSSPGAHFGARGPKDGKPPTPAALLLPRLEDNSSGGQTFLTSPLWKSLQGNSNYLHYSAGAGTAFLVMRQKVGERWQSGAVRVVTGFSSGAQTGRFSPVDQQLYVSGMNGWGCYTPADGCFERVRFTGGTPVPIKFEARENGVLLEFDSPIDQAVARETSAHFAQCWNYHYSAAYGSLEFSVRYPNTAAHDPLEITSTHVLEGGKRLFLEIPQLIPAQVVHLHVGTGPERAQDFYLTVQELTAPFTEYPGYQKIAKNIPLTPATTTSMAMPPPAKPNPWTEGSPGRKVTVDAALGLQFAQKHLTVAPGERITLEFKNPDLVPHNFVLLKPGTLLTVGNQVNALISDPTGLSKHYVPDSSDVLVYTDMVDPQKSFTIHFDAPKEKGDYPYLCTFPGHWQAMNGVLKVE